MRASELLGQEVRDAGGELVGRVIDVLATLDGPSTGRLPSPRVTALIVSRHRLGTFLGYQRPDQRGPWLIRVVVEALHRHNTVVEVSRVAEFGHDHIILATDSH